MFIRENKEGRSKRNIKLVIEYDGTYFCGWQVQANERTIQGEVEKALQSLFNQSVQLVAAGRTDTGVHALGQVAHFKTDSDMDISTVHRGLNSLLPDDIVVLDAKEMNSSFHARFDAKSRRYQYRITRRKRAIGRQYAWYISYSLDVTEIEKGTKILRGQQNFQSFCTAESNVSHHICTVYDVHWGKKEHELTFNIEANRFLQHMVRTIVGTLVEVGRGRWPANEVQHILKSQDRRKAGPTAPAHGLYLTEVTYG
jgi:tRNA pseudouridine38-40 synthase